MERWDAASMDRGTCPVCDREMQITKKGRIRTHGSKQGWPPSNCDGSGQKPKED